MLNLLTLHDTILIDIVGYYLFSHWYLPCANWTGLCWTENFKLLQIKRNGGLFFSFLLFSPSLTFSFISFTTLHCTLLF